MNTKNINSLIKALRIRYWYEGIKQQTGCSNAHQLERLIEPLVATAVDDRTPFRNKWRRYKTGVEAPRRAFVNRVDAKVPGSAREFNHPLWEVLRLGNLALDDVDSWMEKLEPRVQAAVYSQIDSAFVLKQRLPYTPMVSRRLVKLGNVDALTAILLYWIESNYIGQIDNARFQARCIYQLLLMMGMALSDRNIAEELFQLFLERVFNQTDWGKGLLFGIDGAHYMQGTELLHCLLYKVKGINLSSSWTDRCRAMYLLLDGKQGLYVKFGLGVVLMPNWQKGPPTKNQWTDWHSDYIDWQWGWLHLNRGTAGIYGEDKLWKLLYSINNHTL